MIEPRSDPILAAFARRAEAAPDAPLVISGRRTATVYEVAALGRSLARSLARSPARGLDASGPPPGPVTALAAPNGPGFLAAFLGLRAAGRVVLLLDATTPAAARSTTAAAMGATEIVVCADPWPTAVEAFSRLTVEPTVAPPDRALDGAVIKLTSGSSGVPRGVVTPAAALAADEAALAATMGLSHGERILAAIPMAHSYGLSSVALPALVRGAVVAVPEAPGPFAALEAAEAVEATFLPTVPAYLAALLAMASPPALPASARRVVSAGAPLDPRTATAFRRRYGLPVQVFYGASECGGITFDREGGAGERGTVGTPVDGVEIELEPQPGSAPGTGRPVVRSPAVAAAYHPQAPELDGRRFVTGDLAGWRDGELALTGRIDDQINVKGKKVDPRAVEAVLCRLEGVTGAAVFAISAGDGGPAVAAVVAGATGHLRPERVRGWCREHLAVHQVPRRIALVRELPLTGRGKLDRQALRALAADRGAETVG